MEIANKIINMKVASRKACLSDFIDCSESNDNDCKNNKNDYIKKNQKEFGHKKRIKP